MDSPNIDVVKRFYEAETAYLESEPREFGIIAATLHAECVMLQPDSLPYAGHWQGHSGFERWMKAFAEAWSALTVDEPQFFPSGQDIVFVRSTVKAKTRVDGTELCWPLLQMITISDGLVREIQPFYWDTAQVAEALGK